MVFFIIITPFINHTTKKAKGAISSLRKNHASRFYLVALYK
ncbi:hypothetical protein LMOh7858_0687 [Listeria monocytogenes str. 4b H7858]|nr:hypothetical protein LMOh7858_0687 [Listeria monocytogenes str. 4b H7858] [Listeria monocytogenes serotype 4b str. H7858]